MGQVRFLPRSVRDSSVARLIRLAGHRQEGQEALRYPLRGRALFESGFGAGEQRSRSEGGAISSSRASRVRFLSLISGV